MSHRRRKAFGGPVAKELLEFRCRDHDTIVVLRVEQVDTTREILKADTDLLWVPREAVRYDEAGALWFVAECPRCSRVVPWTEGAVRNELARARGGRRVVRF